MWARSPGSIHHTAPATFASRRYDGRIASLATARFCSIIGVRSMPLGIHHSKSWWTSRLSRSTAVSTSVSGAASPSVAAESCWPGSASRAHASARERSAAPSLVRACVCSATKASLPWSAARVRAATPPGSTVQSLMSRSASATVTGMTTAGANSRTATMSASSSKSLNGRGLPSSAARSAARAASFA